jgi:hypothetical protein
MELDESRMGLNNLQGQTSHSSKVVNMNMRLVPLAKCFIKAPHPSWNLLFVQKLNLVNGIGKNACMEIMQLGV